MLPKNWLMAFFRITLVVSHHPNAIAKSTVKRDYPYKTPLLQAGRVTIGLPIQDLPVG
jgi:hypothetical protein